MKKTWILFVLLTLGLAACPPDDDPDPQDPSDTGGQEDCPCRDRGYCSPCMT